MTGGGRGTGGAGTRGAPTCAGGAEGGRDALQLPHSV